MTISIRQLRRPLPISLALVASLACCVTAASAQSTAPTTPATNSDTLRLTEEQRSAILATNTPESAAAARGELTGAERTGRGIHGEVGAMIGTNGARGIYGVAAIPLGNNGSAVVSFEDTQYGNRSRPTRP